MMFDDTILALKGNNIFQHDGAPVHNVHVVRDCFCLNSLIWSILKLESWLHYQNLLKN